MKKSEILEKINEIIVDEKGQKVNINDLFVDSQLDSLGITITLVMIDAEFPIFKGVTTGKEFDSLDIPNLTMRDLITKCRLSITNTSTEQNSDQDM